MLKKILALIFLFGNTIVAAPQTDEASTPAKDNDTAITSSETHDQLVVRKKDLEKFYNILVDCCARIYSLKVCNNATINGTLTTNGKIEVTSGNLVVDTGNITAGGNITVDGNGTFGGSGTFGGPLTIGACTLDCSGGALVVNNQPIASTLAYGYAYTTISPLPVPDNSAVLLSIFQPATAFGITHPSGTTLQVANAGTYLITFSVNADQTNEFSIRINATTVPGSSYSCESSLGNLTQTTGQVIAVLNAGDLIRLVNTSGAPVSLQNTGISANTVTASLLVRQLA